ncbi:CynX/NimT family MFS transporter [Bacillus salipaludis]|uniref:CynX/NimT family MFS transporter n=1 Tax=Bacillus salipaludis TaxID=2547811 RepID=A0ABW8RK45_9BACI
MRFIYLLVVLFFASLNLRPSITSVGPLLDTIQKELGMNGIEASLLTTLPVICMGLFSLIATLLNYQLGIERSLFIGLFFIMIATFFRIITHDSYHLLMTAIVAGIGIGIAGPILSGFIKKHFPEHPGVTSVYSVSMVIGASLACSVSIPLSKIWNDSWQKTLGFWGIPALIACLLLLPLLKKTKIKIPSMTLPKTPIKNIRVWIFTLFFGCMSAIFYSLTAWLSPAVQKMGMDHFQSGLVLTLFTVIQIPVSFLIPVLVSKYQHRKSWLLICCIFELIGVILLIMNASPWFATAFLGIGAGGLFPLALLLPIEETTNSKQATSWAAMIQFGGFILGSLGPILMGYTVDTYNNFFPAFLGLIFIILLMIVTVLIIGDKKESAQQQISLEI